MTTNEMIQELKRVKCQHIQFKIVNSNDGDFWLYDVSTCDDIHEYLEHKQMLDKQVNSLNYLYNTDESEVLLTVITGRASKDVEYQFKKLISHFDYTDYEVCPDYEKEYERHVKEIRNLENENKDLKSYIFMLLETFKKECDKDWMKKGD